MTAEPSGQIQFGIFFHGVNFTTIWHWPESGDQINFESFRRFAQTAERGKFAAFFVGEGLRLREHLGQLHDLDVVGRPDAQTVDAALASVTSQIGLVATQSTTYNDPADLAYRLASVNRLTGGRSAWNIVTTHNEWTGANFRRGGYVSHEDRYRHADAFTTAVKEIWRAGDRGEQNLRYTDDFYDINVHRTLPLTPGGRPVLFQAGDSAAGRDFAVKHADIIFSAHPEFDDATQFAADIRARAVLAGRAPDAIRPFPGSTFVIGDTDAEARDKWRAVREAQITPQTAIAYLEQFWGRDLKDIDPEGPLPGIDPVVDSAAVTRGSGFEARDTRKLVDGWRQEARENDWNVRDFVIHHTSRGNDTNGFIGSPATIADSLQRYADSGIVAGFNISPYLTPVGLDDIVNRLVPELQDRGIYPADYAGTTLREHLGLGYEIP